MADARLIRLPPPPSPTPRKSKLLQIFVHNSGEKRQNQKVLTLNVFVSGVNNTGDKREKFSGVILFSFFLKSLVECTLHLKMEFLHIIIFRCRQANIGMTV